MPDPSPAPRRRLRWLRSPLLWLLALLLAFAGYSGWKAYDYRAAMREAEALGWVWEQEDTLTLLKQDWDNAFKADTWQHHPGELQIRAWDGASDTSADPTLHRELLHRLRPERLTLLLCQNMDAVQGLDSLVELQISFPNLLQDLSLPKGLRALRSLNISGADQLRNLDGLKEAPNLEALYIQQCPSLQNIESLTALPGLREICIGNCTALPGLGALQKCPTLQTLTIYGCPQLQTAGALKGLTQLKKLILGLGTSDDALREIRAAIPHADVIYDDLML